MLGFIRAEDFVTAFTAFAIRKCAAGRRGKYPGRPDLQHAVLTRGARHRPDREFCIERLHAANSVSSSAQGQHIFPGCIRAKSGRSNAAGSAETRRKAVAAQTHSAPQSGRHTACGDAARSSRGTRFCGACSSGRNYAG